MKYPIDSVAYKYGTRYGAPFIEPVIIVDIEDRTDGTQRYTYKDSDGSLVKVRAEALCENSDIALTNAKKCVY